MADTYTARVEDDVKIDDVVQLIEASKARIIVSSSLAGTVTFRAEPADAETIQDLPGVASVVKEDETTDPGSGSNESFA